MVGELRGRCSSSSCVRSICSILSILCHVSPPISPEQVAAAVVGLFGKHRPVAAVPRSLAFGSTQWAAMPAWMKRRISRWSGMDTMFTDYDHTARASYEQRTTGPA